MYPKWRLLLHQMVIAYIGIAFGPQCSRGTGTLHELVRRECIFALQGDGDVFGRCDHFFLLRVKNVCRAVRPIVVKAENESLSSPFVFHLGFRTGCSRCCQLFCAEA